MSKVEHDPALVERVHEAIFDRSTTYASYAISAIDAVRAWDAEHAEPQTLHDAAAMALRALDGAWVILDERLRAAHLNAYTALSVLRDAVKGECK